MYTILTEWKAKPSYVINTGISSHLICEKQVKYVKLQSFSGPVAQTVRAPDS